MHFSLSYFRSLLRFRTHSLSSLRYISSALNSKEAMNIQHFNAWSDNYMYVVYDKDSKESAAVDPVEPQKIVDFVQSQGLTLKYVLTTHHHADHASGNDKLLELAQKHLGQRPTVCGGDDRVAAVSKIVSHDETLEPIGSIGVRCLHTPCHTSGHICYFLTCGSQQPAVFTGDTLFIAGCGRFFEGTPEQMHASLMDKLAKLPADTLVYCGHEYTRKNLQFAVTVEPNNADAKAKLMRLQANPQMPSIPSSIADELRTNPFMRVNQAEVQRHAGSNDAFKVMAALRKEKDRF